MTHERRAGFALLVLFILSGFAGLIYQSIWSHYLGLVLGHAAYAQTLVLGLFMGGMALGAWLAGKWTLRIRHLILGYAVIEGVIGLFGLLFHPIFVGYMSFSQGSILPSLGSPALAGGYQWISSGLLILPQCILLGATFPLLSAGYLRLAPREEGRVLGGLYFSNSIGAAFGALFSTFVLLPAIGMPGAMVTAGVLNLVVAIGSLVVWRLSAPPIAIAPQSAAATTADADGAQNPLLQTMVAATFLSGAFSFVYEIGWIRLLNQALGATVHSFELMLAAFILGLAFGGLWIRQRGERITDAVRYAGYAQVWMGICALVSVVVFAHSFEWVGWMMRTFQRTDDGYTLFSLGSATIAILVMFPAAFFAGMTLPLFTMALLRKGSGERSIARIYSANTLGAIAGVALTVHVLIPVIGVKHAVVLAAAGDAVMGLYLLRLASAGSATGFRLSVVALLAALMFSFAASSMPPQTQVAGVFRDGVTSLPADSPVVFLRDGKTATVGVYATPDGSYGTISTNGKPDATLSVHLDTPPSQDEVTMAMAASLPLAFHPAPKDIGIIGWGSGLTTHTILGSPLPVRVESIEIERQMWTGARQFGDRVARAYDDPRSHVAFDDARTWFSTGGRRYDVIISEPSNPWVSGIASLFTEQFYTFLKGHLNEGGLVVQWIQSYELGDPLLARMIRALANTFPHLRMYATNEGDLLLVSSVTPILPLNMQALSHEPLRSELARIGLRTADDYAFRFLGDERVARTFSDLMGGLGHSDYYPTVALEAPRDRFKRNRSDALYAVNWNGLPVMEILVGVSPAPRHRTVVSSTLVDSLRGRALHTIASLESRSLVAELDQTTASHVAVLLQLSSHPVTSHDAERWGNALASVAASSIAYLPASDQLAAWSSPAWLVGNQPAFVVDAMAAYAAAAARDADAMSRLALHALEQHAQVLPGAVREQLLVMAMTAAAKKKDFATARRLEDTFGNTPGLTTYLASVRGFLLGWADTKD